MFGFLVLLERLVELSSLAIGSGCVVVGPGGHSCGVDTGACSNTDRGCVLSAVGL